MQINTYNNQAIDFLLSRQLRLQPIQGELAQSSYSPANKQDSFSKIYFGGLTVARDSSQTIIDRINSASFESLRATQRDLPDIAKFIQDIARTEYGALYNRQSIEDRLQMLQYSFNAPNGTVFVVKDKEGQVIASAVTTPADYYIVKLNDARKATNGRRVDPRLGRRTAVLTNIYVKDDLRGQGVGGALWKRRLDFIESQDYTRVLGYTPNKRFAIHYIEDRGFKQGWRSTQVDTAVMEAVERTYPVEERSLFTYLAKNLRNR